MKPINILSTFDGKSGGMLAAKRAGINVNRYYASEIDKYAIQISEKNHSNIITRLGDIEKWREWHIDWASIDLLIGGSPCQGFSYSGKQLAFDDPRSKLFFVFVDILKHIRKFNPDVKFLLENVKMKEKSMEVITDHLEVEPILINSNLVSAQNRRRYYWFNWEASQPNDKKIFLKDIMEGKIENPVIMSDRFVERQAGRKCLVSEPKLKAACLSAGEYVKNGRQGDYIKCDQNGTQLVFGGHTEGKIHYRKLTPIGS